MAIPNVLQTGRSGMIAAKAGIATAGHNISNANTEGYSRQRILTEAAESLGGQFGHNTIGTGTMLARTERVNDNYVEKQIRNAQRDLSNCEEKDVAFRQVEDIFNEMSGDGLNRLVSRFFNDFRKLSEEPENPAIRQALLESSQAMVNDFHRLRNEVVEVRKHLDQRISGFIEEVNSVSKEISDINDKIKVVEASGGSPNDVLDKRDQLIKKLASYFDITVHKDHFGNLDIDLKGIGPIVTGNRYETLSVESTPADEFGKVAGALDIKSTGSARSLITHSIRGGKIGALVENRDHLISKVLERLDDLAFTMAESVNEVHSRGFNLLGESEVDFFEPLDSKEGAAERLSLSESIKENSNKIATALIPDAPGDNRIALAITSLQNEKLLNDGHATMDEWYNSIVSDIGIAASRNRSAMSQEKDIVLQLNKIREQISGVSVDEETANLMQFQHAFDASARVIQVADDMLKTVLAIKRD